MRESEEQVRLLLDSTAEAIYGVDLKGNCTFCNPACARMLGFPDTHVLLGQHMHKVAHHHRPGGTPYPVEECRIYQAFQEGQGTHVKDEIFWRTDGTSFPVEYWSYPVRRDGAVIGSVVTFLDITEQITQERVLADALQTAKAASQAAGDRLANLLGRLPGPINDLLLLTGRLLHTELSAEQRDDLTRMQTATRALQELEHAAQTSAALACDCVLSRYAGAAMHPIPDTLHHHLRRHGQEHVLTWWDHLTDAERRTLLEQVQALDLPALRELYEQREHAYRFRRRSASSRFRWSAHDAPHNAAARQHGEQALRAGEVAVLLVAGGQGSRLGFEHPKGMFPVGPVSGKSLFQMHAEKVLATQRRYGKPVPFLVMTSPATDAETRQFFAEHHYFGLPAEEVHFSSSKARCRRSTWRPANYCWSSPASCSSARTVTAAH